MVTPNPFDPATILDGIRRWVEIETPTERSRSPTTAVSVMPNAAIAATAWVCRIDAAVAGVANPGMSSEKATAISTPTSTTP